MFISRLFPKRSAQSFRADNSGMAAVEFGLIAPVALIMMIGAMEYSRAVVLARRFNLVTATISDLVARDDYEDTTSMAGLKNAMSTIWSPYDPATLDLKVIAVRQGAAGGTKAGQNYVYWGKDLISGADISACTSYSGLPGGLLSPGASTIVVNATYTYHTLFGVKVPGMATTTQNWTSSSSHAPRNLCVGWPTAICTTPCEN